MQTGSECIKEWRTWDDKESWAAQAHKEDGYRWWVQRLSRMFQLHDEVRIDHFRGFAGAQPS